MPKADQMFGFARLSRRYPETKWFVALVVGLVTPIERTGGHDHFPDVRKMIATFPVTFFLCRYLFMLLA